MRDNTWPRQPSHNAGCIFATMNESSADVLIVGAGASGLTLACDLRRRGVSCRVIEKLTQPFAGSRGKGLQPRTLEVFDDLGVVEAITGAGGPFPSFRGRKAERVLWDRDLATVMGLAALVPDASAPYGMWMIPQAATESILRARLACLGGAVEQGTELVGFESGQARWGASDAVVRAWTRGAALPLPGGLRRGSQLRA